jgi:hypothetical protein
MYKNVVNLIGFLGKDAEVKASQDNSTNFTVLSLATKESWKSKQTNEWEYRMICFLFSGSRGFMPPCCCDSESSRMHVRRDRLRTSEPPVCAPRRA